MKKVILLSLFFISTLGVFTQNCNLVVFSEDGLNFFLIVNGERINDQAKANVKKTDISTAFASVKIKFADESIAEISKPNLMLAPGEEITYVIKKKKNGEMALILKNQTSASNTAMMDDRNDNNTNNSGGSTTTTTTTGSSNVVIKETTTTTTTTGGTTDNVTIGIGGIGVSVSVNDGTGVSGSTTTTTTTTTTVAATEVVDPCAKGMNSTEFSNAKKSISSSSFDDTKVSTIKNIVGGKCFTSAQLKEMISLLSFEDNKLEVAKYAYAYVVDPGNYYVINDEFTFSSNIDDLNNHINSNRRR